MKTQARKCTPIPLLTALSTVAVLTLVVGCMPDKKSDAVLGDLSKTDAGALAPTDASGGDPSAVKDAANQAGDKKDATVASDTSSPAVKDTGSGPSIADAGSSAAVDAGSTSSPDTSAASDAGQPSGSKDAGGSKPLGPGCCKTDADSKAGVCANTMCKKSAAPLCWTDSECPKNGMCIGAQICACGNNCFAPDKGGKCSTGPIGGGASKCKTINPSGYGLCDMLMGYGFDGKACVTVSGCGCKGTTCEGIYKTQAACDKECGGASVGSGGTTCHPIKPGELGMCKMIIGYAVNANGNACLAIGGCGCKAKNVDKCSDIYPTKAACEKKCVQSGGSGGTPPTPKSCKTVPGTQLGNCSNVLGWANTGGICSQITGCGCVYKGINLCSLIFKTEKDCKKICGL